MSARDAMAIGTAGYTAMLAVMALERQALTPDARPGGGDGRRRRCRFGRDRAAGETRLPGRSPRPAAPQEADYLKSLGATEIIERKELTGAGAAARPRSAGPAASTSVGSTTLANVLSMTRYGGRLLPAVWRAEWTCRHRSLRSFCAGCRCLASISVMCPLPVRQEAWRRLETDLDRAKIEAMTTEIGLDEVIDAGRRIVDGQVRGRIVVKIG